jgi:hypothetical protein
VGFTEKPCCGVYLYFFRFMGTQQVASLRLKEKIFLSHFVLFGHKIKNYRGSDLYVTCHDLCNAICFCFYYYYWNRAHLIKTNLSTMFNRNNIKNTWENFLKNYCSSHIDNASLHQIGRYSFNFLQFLSHCPEKLWKPNLSFQRNFVDGYLV